MMGTPLFAQTQAGKGTVLPAGSTNGTVYRSQPQGQQAPKETYQPQRNTPAEARPVAGQVERSQHADPERSKSTNNRSQRSGEELVMVNGQWLPADQVQSTPAPVHMGGTSDHFNDGVPADVDDLFLELNNCHNKRWISIGEFLRMDQATRMIIMAAPHQYCIDQVQLLFLVQLLPSCASAYFY